LKAKKPIIVTGGAGLIGSAIVWQLNQMGESNVIIVDHLGTSTKWQNLRALNFLDYMEKETFIAMVRDKSLPFTPATIFHLGACSSTTENDATYLINNNFLYTRDLATCALNHGVRFIYASSAATYGDGFQGYNDDEKQLDKLRPLNMYGYSKQLFDQWVVRHKLNDRLVGLKYFNVFGPNEWHKGDMRSMVLKAFEQIQSAGKIRLFRSHHPDYEDGKQLRDFIYVKDAAAMTVAFHEHADVNGIYNIGTGQARSWVDLANAVFTALEKSPQIEFIEMPEKLRNRYQYFTMAETAKLKKNNLPVSRWSLESAIADYVRNYLLPGNHLGDGEN
jgi:ADP-L-glycero-D-manno-heptose 6-epimerase